MNDSVLLAQIDVPAALFWAIRLAAGVGGAILGWLVTGPVMRLLFRLAFQKPIPPSLLPWTKAGGSLLLGFLLFYFLPLGGGLGWGWGPGDGGGPGLGPGLGGTPGTGKTNADSAGKDTSRDKNAGSTIVRERINIELIGPRDPRFKGEEKFFLLNNSPPAMNRTELEQYFKKNQDRLIVSITRTGKSPALALGVLDDLLDLMRNYGISELREAPLTK